MIKFLILYFLTFCVTTSTSAQETDSYADSLNIQSEMEQSDENIIIPDTTLIKSAIIIPSDTIRALKSMKHFAYLHSMDSLLKEQQRANEKKMRTATRSISLLDRLLNSGFIKLLFWIVGIVILFLIIIRLIGTKGFFIKKKSLHNVAENAEESSSAVKRDYLDLIRRAVNSGDYRSAVKYQFLHTLHRLSDNSHLSYSADKTNIMYRREIADDKKKEFGKLISHYEYVWYGRINIGAEKYNTIENYFADFNKKI